MPTARLVISFSLEWHIQNPKDNKPRSSKYCFLACFGVSQKVEESGKVERSVYNNDKKKKDIGLLSWSKVVMKNINKSGCKTVPIDHHHHITEQSDADHHQQQCGHNMNNNIHTTNNAKSSTMKWFNTCKLPKKRDQKIQNRTICNKTKPFDHQTPKVAKLFSKDQAPEAPKEILELATSDVRSEENGAVQNLKSNDHVADSDKTCTQKRLLKTTRRPITGLSQTQLGSPKPNRASMLAHSVSMPPPSLNVDSPSRSLAKTKTTRQSNNTTARRLDPFVGMSVLMVILIIMLVWGQLCAVVCTSAWIYFVARLRTQSRNGDDKDSGDVDLNSEEYKKKVVLEGLLERNHRASTL